MGCAASKTAVIPIEGGKDLGNGHVDGNSEGASVPIAAAIPSIDDDIKISAQTTKGLAFEVPITDEENLIKKHPPKRLQRLEDQQMPNLTHRLLDEKQAEAEQRRQQILSQRIQSAKARQKVKRTFIGSGEIDI
ncbi:uncharacterized protein LOC106665201 isoform X2 [Cimex lectularius]|uniref:Uncharacterized protein n=1 Tax=Cimex lectularius TaxID=79782 RepID=A0A8I6SQQ3_CIMLE|nr:uncharacterized protein LOC106665201 isoform X2 [Cimex lectularius]